MYIKASSTFLLPAARSSQDSVLKINPFKLNGIGENKIITN